jgi:hypothetical protein
LYLNLTVTVNYLDAEALFAIGSVRGVEPGSVLEFPRENQAPASKSPSLRDTKSGMTTGNRQCHESIASMSHQREKEFIFSDMNVDSSKIMVIVFIYTDSRRPGPFILLVRDNSFEFWDIFSAVAEIMKSKINGKWNGCIYTLVDRNCT